MAGPHEAPCAWPSRSSGQGKVKNLASWPCGGLERPSALEQNGMVGGRFEPTIGLQAAAYWARTVHAG